MRVIYQFVDAAGKEVRHSAVPLGEHPCHIYSVEILAKEGEPSFGEGNITVMSVKLQLEG